MGSLFVSRYGKNTHGDQPKGKIKTTRETQTTNRFIAKNLVKDYFSWREEKMHRGGDLNDYLFQVGRRPSGVLAKAAHADLEHQDGDHADEKC